MLLGAVMTTINLPWPNRPFPHFIPLPTGLPYYNTSIILNIKHLQKSENTIKTQY